MLRTVKTNLSIGFWYGVEIKEGRSTTGLFALESQNLHKNVLKMKYEN